MTVFIHRGAKAIKDPTIKQGTALSNHRQNKTYFSRLKLIKTIEVYTISLFFIAMDSLPGHKTKIHASCIYRLYVPVVKYDLVVSSGSTFSNSSHLFVISSQPTRYNNKSPRQAPWIQFLTNSISSIRFFVSF